MLTSSIPMVIGIAASLPQQQPGPDVEAGWMHLSLPLGLMGEPDGLRGWDRFEPIVPIDCQLAKQSKTGVVGKEPVPVEPPLAIRLFGILNEDATTVFCLFDASRRRWIRLSVGQSDEISQIRIVGMGGDELLEDMVNGNLYAIDKDTYRLLPFKRRKDS